MLQKPENREHFIRLKFSHDFTQKLNFWRNHTLSFLRVALGKQGIYLLLRIGITRNLSPKILYIPYYWLSLPILFSLHGYFASKTYFFDDLACLQQG